MLDVRCSTFILIRDVSIPSNRGVVSNKPTVTAVEEPSKSQSPRIGEFFPTILSQWHWSPGLRLNPLESGSSFQLCYPNYTGTRKTVSIPSIGEFFPTQMGKRAVGTGQKSQSPRIGEFFPTEAMADTNKSWFVSIPSNRGVLSNILILTYQRLLVISLNPLESGSSFQLIEKMLEPSKNKSQSPRIGEFFPTHLKLVVLRLKNCLNPLESGSSFQQNHQKQEL